MMQTPGYRRAPHGRYVPFRSILQSDLEDALAQSATDYTTVQVEAPVHLTSTLTIPDNAGIYCSGAASLYATVAGFDLVQGSTSSRVERLQVGLPSSGFTNTAISVLGSTEQKWRC